MFSIRSQSNANRLLALNHRHYRSVQIDWRNRRHSRVQWSEWRSSAPALSASKSLVSTLYQCFYGQLIGRLRSKLKHCITNRFQSAGSLAYGGHEVRVQDQSSVVLNKILLRINEDKRILKEDGLITNTNFLVCNRFAWVAWLVPNLVPSSTEGWSLLLHQIGRRGSWGGIHLRVCHWRHWYQTEYL